MQTKDLASVRKEPQHTVTAIRKAGGDASLLDESHFCLRGLEHMRSKHTYKERRKNQRSIVRHVLDEQDRQRQMGIRDPKGLQVMSSVCTRWARDRALSAAAGDAQDAASIVSEGRGTTKQEYKPKQMMMAEKEFKDFNRSVIGDASVICTNWNEVKRVKKDLESFCHPLPRLPRTTMGSAKTS